MSTDSAKPVSLLTLRTHDDVPSDALQTDIKTFKESVDGGQLPSDTNTILEELTQAARSAVQPSNIPISGIMPGAVTDQLSFGGLGGMGDFGSSILGDSNTSIANMGRYVSNIPTEFPNFPGDMTPSKIGQTIGQPMGLLPQRVGGLMSNGELNADNPVSSVDNVVHTTTAKMTTPEVPKGDVIVKEENGTPTLNLRNVDWAPNPLNQYRNCTYKFRLVAVSEPFPTTYEGYLAKLQDKSKNVVIMETGGTKYNITGVSIQNMVGPDSRRTNTSAQQITINVTEPLGISLFDAFKHAGEVLEFGNFYKTFYFLELRFTGYNDDGSIAKENIGFDNVSSDDLSERAKHGFLLYRIQINNVEMDMDAAGSRYVIRAMPVNEHAFDTLTFRLAQPIRIDGKGQSVQVCFKQLVQNLNEDVKQRYMGSQVYTYEIVCHDDAINKSIMQTTDNKTVLSDDTHSGRGRTIGEFIESIILNSTLVEEFKQIADDPASYKKLFVETFRIYPEVEYIEKSFDPLLGDYYKKITYHIYRYQTLKPYASLQHKKEMDKKVEEMYAELRKKNMLKKKYSYIYTGENTEVLNFDVKMNFNWAALINIYNGDMRSYASVAVGQQFNEEAKKKLDGISKALTEHKIINEEMVKSINNPERNTELEELSSSQRDVINTRLVTIAALQAQVKELQANKDTAVSAAVQQEITTKLYQIRAETVETARLFDRMNLSRIAGNRMQKYAEDISSRSSSDYKGLRIAFHRNPQDLTTQHGMGSHGSWDTGKAVMSSVLDQTYCNVEKELMRITLDIRGDPYWLGNTNMDKPMDQYTDRSSAINPVFYIGDHCFVLTFRYPIEITDEGTMVFNDKDGSLFNGVYMVQSVTSSFEGGQFKQTLTAMRVTVLLDAKVL